MERGLSFGTQTLVLVAVVVGIGDRLVQYSEIEADQETTMMIVLTKEEYDDLIKKSHASDLVAEEKLETMKKDLAERISKVVQRSASSMDSFGLRQMHPIFLEIAELLKHYT